MGSIDAAVTFDVRLGAVPLEFGNFPSWPFRFWFNWVVGAAAAEFYTRASRPTRWMTDGRVALLFGIVGFALLQLDSSLFHRCHRTCRIDLQRAIVRNDGLGAFALVEIRVSLG